MNKSQYLSNFWIELTFLITTLSFLDFFNPFLPLFFFMFHLPIDALLPFYILWIPFLCPPLRFGVFWKSLSLYLVIIMTVHCPLKKISLSKLKKNYLFLAVLGLCCGMRTFTGCGMQASHCGGLSHCGARVLGHTGFRFCSSRALERSRFSSCGTLA